MIRTPHPHQVEAVDRLRDAAADGKAEITIEGERFRAVDGFARYFVGDQGNVFSSIRAGRFLRATIGSHGYPYVSLMADGAATPVKTLVHRLVAGAFVANPNRLPVVNHLNGVKLDARAVNLEWCSYSTNNDHARATGLSSAQGETHYAAKLKAGEVARIRYLGEQGVLHRVIAAEFGVRRQCVDKIVRGEAWKGLAR